MDTMSVNKISRLKLRLQYEFAYKIILNSIIFILVGLCYLFASNILSFNWYSLLFGILAIFFIYLKKNSYLLIEDNTISVYYFKFYKRVEVSVDMIHEIIVNANDNKVEINNKKNKVIQIYLNDLEKEKLLNYIIHNYPNISCIVVE